MKRKKEKADLGRSKNREKEKKPHYLSVCAKPLGGHGRRRDELWLTVSLDKNHSKTEKVVMIKRWMNGWRPQWDTAYIQVKWHHHLNSPREMIWSASGQNQSPAYFTLQLYLFVTTWQYWSLSWNNTLQVFLSKGEEREDLIKPYRLSFALAQLS